VEGGKVKKLIRESKRTITFLGTLDKRGKPAPYATGFFVRVDNIFHLVTAKHVIADMNTGQLKDDEMWTFTNLKKGGLNKVPIKDMREKLNLEWIFHRSKKVDLAILPCALELDLQDVRVIPEKLFVTVENLFELYDIFFLSFQPGVEIKNEVSPIIRTGVISRIDKDKTFYIDGSAFPGNSGSPVFFKPSPITFREEGITLSGNELGGKFIGIIGAYVPYSEYAVSLQTGKPRVIFEENTGLSLVWSVDYLKEILKSEPFKRQLRSIQSKLVTKK